MRAREFYSIVAASTLLGVVLDFLNVNAIRILFWSAVINGLLAPFLLVGILIVACGLGGHARPAELAAQHGHRSA